MYYAQLLCCLFCMSHCEGIWQRSFFTIKQKDRKGDNPFAITRCPESADSLNAVNGNNIITLIVCPRQCTNNVLFLDVNFPACIRSISLWICGWLCMVVLLYSEVIMGAMASQITDVSILYLTVCSGANQRKHQGSASLAFVRGIHRWPVNSPHKGPVKRKMFPFDDVIMCIIILNTFMWFI